MFFWGSDIPAVLGVRLGNVKENLCGSYVMETVKKIPKIKPVCNALFYVSCHLKTILE